MTTHHWLAYYSDHYPLPFSLFAHRCEPVVTLCGVGRVLPLSIEQAPVLIRSSIFCAIG